MNSTKPFIHLLETPYGKYFFDVNTDRVYKVEESIYYALKLLLEGKQDSICNETAQKIGKMKQEGLLKTNRPKTMKHPATDYMDYYLNHKLRGITLQVTQNCNFRCEYCVYGQDSTLNRSHSTKRMSFK